jgi:CO/xanthine dehydrogenase Mo-binding subunit
MHFGQTPEYLVEFVETPFVEGPYGARGLGEHGIVGIPAALANALSVAAGCELDELPVTPEKIWLAKSGGKA